MRDTLDANSWIENNLAPTDRIMFMRIAAAHPSLKGTGITRWFWRECATNFGNPDYTHVFAEGNTEKSIQNMEKIGFESVRVIQFGDLPQEFWDKLVTPVENSRRYALQVMKIPEV